MKTLLFIFIDIHYSVLLVIYTDGGKILIHGVAKGSLGLKSRSCAGAAIVLHANNQLNM